MRKSPRIVEKNNSIYVTDDYVIPPGTANKVVALAKYDVTDQMGKVLDVIYNRSRMSEIKKRVDDGNIKIICLCGSTKFREEYRSEFARFTFMGHIVLTVGCLKGDPEWGTAPKGMLDDLHKRKIDLADIVYFINKDGYIGESTQSEFDYAMSRHKFVDFMDIEHGQKLIDEFNSHGKDLFVEGK